MFQIHVAVMGGDEYDPGQMDETEHEAVKSGELVAYRVSVVSLLEDEEADAPFAHLPVVTDDDGSRWVVHDSVSHVGDTVGIEGLYDGPQKISAAFTRHLAAEMFGHEWAKGLPVGSLVSFKGAGRHGGAGRLWEVHDYEVGDDGYTGAVRLTQLDGKTGARRKVWLSDVILAADLGPVHLVEGRNRGGVRVTYRPRWRGGYLVYAGDYADHVVETFREEFTERMLWRCRAIDSPQGPWEQAGSRAGAVQAYARRFPGVGVTSQPPIL